MPLFVSFALNSILISLGHGSAPEDDAPLPAEDDDDESGSNLPAMPPIAAV
jgi:hypothetical protein